MDITQEQKKLEERKNKLKERETAWEKKKRDHLLGLRLQSESIEKYLGKIEQGQNFTGDIKYHMEQIEKIFEDIENEESSIKTEREDIESEEDDLNLDEKYKTARELITRVSRFYK